LVVHGWPNLAASDPGTCRNAILRHTGKLQATTLKAMQKCEDGVLQGKRPSSFDCRGDAKTMAMIAKAEGKLRAGIGKACGGANKTCNAADSGPDADDPLLAIGWDIGACPDLARSGCGAAIADCGDVTDCLACAVGAATTVPLALVYSGRALVPDAGVARCRRAIGKESVKALVARAKAVERCWSNVGSGAAGFRAPCPSGDATGATAAAIAKAATRARAKICAACGGADKACAGGDDLDPGTTAFPADCPDVTAPGGASCVAPVRTFDGLVACVDCVTGFATECLAALETPWGGAYPPTCNAGCGNGRREGAEACDRGDDAACPGRCASDCTCIESATPTPAPTPPTPTPTATPQPPACGDGTIDLGETCDASADAACPGRCRSDCTCDPAPATPTATPGAAVCGNGSIDGGESCELFAGGDAACPRRCRTDECTCLPVCGDGVVAADEVCDGAAFRGQTCTTVGLGAGILECRPDCRGVDARGCAPVTGLPPDPATIAPALDLGVVSDLGSATRFLYEGTPRIQLGVAPGTIDTRRAAVVRGRVIDRAGAALPGVRVEVRSHPEYGTTLSRTDGMFDLAVNGGQRLRIGYDKPGHLPSERGVDVAWQEYAVVSDVTLVAIDPNVTSIDLTSPAPFQVARGSVSSDADGLRQATVLFPAGTAATLVFPDDSEQAITTLSIRATEYTVGAVGPNAMPATLPPTSGYTYAVELTADESAAAGARRVSFSQPLLLYVENFVGAPIGVDVPVGWFDREGGSWVASENGRVVRILALVAGSAVLDTDGDDLADDGAALGITTAERQQLAALYAPATSLWRSQITHFTPYDLNWMAQPPPDAQPPDLPKPTTEDEDKPDDTCEAKGSIIECETQVLGERLRVPGTNLTLNYRSDRVPGRLLPGRLRIPLTTANPAPSLRRVELAVTVGGRVFHSTHAPSASLVHAFAWDGVDAFGRALQGLQPVKVVISYFYAPTYWTSQDLRRQFGEYVFQRSFPTRFYTEFAYTQSYDTRMGLWRYEHMGLGGWTLSDHHVYDPFTRVLQTGTGERRSASNANRFTISPVGWAPPTGSAPAPSAVAVGADGGIYVADHVAGVVYRVGAGGVTTIIAGHDGWGSEGDGGPATAAQLTGPLDLAVGPDGSLYVLENNLADDDAERLVRVRRILPDGTIVMVAGTGVDGFSGDDGPATAAQLSDARGITVAPDGVLYIADSRNHRVRRVSTDGTIRTLAGTGVAGFSGDGRLLPSTQLAFPRDVAAAANGDLYIADTLNYRIRRILPGGVIETIAGTGLDVIGPENDDGPALAATLGEIASIAVSPDGSVFMSDDSRLWLRRVDIAGRLRTVASSVPDPPRCADPLGGGEGHPGERGCDSLQLQSRASVFSVDPAAFAVAFGPDGDTYLVTAFPWFLGIETDQRLFRVTGAFPGYSGREIVLPGDDASTSYIFSLSGRHLQTRHALTGALLQRFGYDAGGRLVRIEDALGNAAVVERDVNGTATAIIGPNGERTALAIAASGELTAVIEPGGGRWELGYEPGGLLASLRDPNENEHRFFYDAVGRLRRDEDPAGGHQALTRQDTGSSSTVLRSTALGRTTRYVRERSGVYPWPRVISATLRTLPDGAQYQTFQQYDGIRRTRDADGTIEAYRDGGSWHLAGPPYASSYHRTTLPSGNSRIVNSYAFHVETLGLPAVPSMAIEGSIINGRREFVSTYDFATHTLVQMTPEGRRTDVTVDDLGRLVRKQSRGLHPTLRAYDARGRVATIVRGAGAESRVQTIEYDSRGHVASISDGLGPMADFGYDLVDRLTTVLTGGAELSFEYDPAGNLTRLTPPGRPAHQFTPTTLNTTAAYIAPVVDGEPSTSTYAHDLDQQPLRSTRPDGRTTEFTYDTAGRLARMVMADVDLRLAYHPVTRQLMSIATPTSTLGYIFDGRLVTGTTWSGEVAGTVAFQYDGDFWTRAIVVNGQSVDFRYDADGRTVGAGDLQITLDPSSGLVSDTVLDGIVDRRLYNGFGELVGYEARYAGAMLYAATYTRDARGRIVMLDETVESDHDVFTYDYDTAGRLAGVTRNGDLSASYTYDANGNRLTRTTTAGIEASVYDDQDRLRSRGDTTYGYTANGELATRTTGSGVTTFAYDGAGQLRGVTLPGGTTVAYAVDGMSHRIARRRDGMLTGAYLWQEDLKPAGELDGNGTLRQRYVYGQNRSAPDYLITPSARYRVLTDHHGSPRLVVDASTGEIVQRMDYDEFGRVVRDTNPGFQPFGFAGGLYDPATRLVRFGARDYDAAAGRWTAKDPILFAGGDSNLYGYVVGDPINLEDQNGLKTYQCQGALAGMGDGLRSGPEWGINPFFHTYLCVNVGGTSVCGGQGPLQLKPLPQLVAPGHATSDSYNPANCDEIDSDPCFEQCLKQSFKQPRPWYVLGFNDCKDWVQDQLDDCRRECDPYRVWMPALVGADSIYDLQNMR